MELCGTRSLNGCVSGDCVLSQFLEALSLTLITDLNIGRELDVVFSVVLSVKPKLKD